MNFGRRDFSRKGLSRFENRVEKQMRSEGLGESGSMTMQALGRVLNVSMLLPWHGARLNALGLGR